MKSSNRLIGVSVSFLVFAVVLSIVVWEGVSLAPAIGLFALGFGSGVGAGLWYARRRG